jgi:RNA 3'-terminal phosphate cyclase (ATP)
MAEGTIELDASAGEGGGQIVRSALTLSLTTGRPIRLRGIRAGRDRPGLRPQHMTAVRAAADVGRAEVRGNEQGSRELEFRPGVRSAGEFNWSVGTAGSAPLVLQTVLPALLQGRTSSRLTVEGGTHNPAAPTYEFFSRTYLPLIGRMGPRVQARLERPGFYPRGGGRIQLDVEPVQELQQIEVRERGLIHQIRAGATVAGLDRSIAERELAAVRRFIGVPSSRREVQELDPACGPGNAVWVEVRAERVTEVFAAVGQKGSAAEQVGERVAREARRWLDVGAPVGRHLADQLLLPMAVAGGGVLRTLPLSSHAWTQVELIRAVTDLPVEVDEQAEGPTTVQVGAL